MKVLQKPRALCCETVIVVLLVTAEQLAMHLGLLLEACTQGLAPCLFFFFPKAAENRIIGFVLRGKKNKRFCKQLWKKPNWSILEPPDLDSVPLMLYKHLFWVFNKLPADKLHNFLQEPLIFSRTTEMAKYILCLYNSLYICM